MSQFDPIAGFYDRHWAPDFHAIADDIIENAFHAHPAAVRRVLDVCCGSGRLAHALRAKGHSVDGVDVSPTFVTMARSRVPDGRFVVADICNPVPPVGLHGYDAALCMYNSVNHLGLLDAVRIAFHHVHGALCPGGLFVLDVLTPTLAAATWNVRDAHVTPDECAVVEANFDEVTGRGRSVVTVFEPDGAGRWLRRRTEIDLTVHDAAALRSALTGAGFEDVHVADWQDDLGVEGMRGRLLMTATSRT